jgi:hypothetical protein
MNINACYACMVADKAFGKCAKSNFSKAFYIRFIPKNSDVEIIIFVRNFRTRHVTFTIRRNVMHSSGARSELFVVVRLV